MSSLRMFSVTLILLSSCSLVSSSGHLRLELTASNNCEIRLITDYSEEIIQLIMGEKRTSSFHPNGRADFIRVGLSTVNGKPESYYFPLRNTGQQLRRVFEASEIVVLIQSVYECNSGFFGTRCQFEGFPTTTAIVTTPATVAITTEGKKIPPTISATSFFVESSVEKYNRIIVALLVIVSITLTVLIIVFGCLIVSSRRPQHIIIADTTQEKTKMMGCSAENKNKEMNGLKFEEPRYTSDPLGRVYI